MGVCPNSYGRILCRVPPSIAFAGAATRACATCDLPSVSDATYAGRSTCTVRLWRLRRSLTCPVLLRQTTAWPHDKDGFAKTHRIVRWIEVKIGLIAEDVKGES